MKEIIDGDLKYDTYKLFSENERLQAIGQMTREIEGTGYVFKTNKKRYPLNKKFQDMKSKTNKS